jgi:hypothetical protein
MTLKTGRDLKSKIMSKEELENNLNRVHEWIRSADQKASIWLTFVGVYLTLTYEKYVSLAKIVYSEIPCISFLYIISLILLIISLYKGFRVIFPKVSHNKRKSLLFFGDIASISLDDYIDKLNKYNDKDFEKDIITQTHISAEISVSKHSNFKESIVYFLISLAVIVLVYLQTITV